MISGNNGGVVDPTIGVGIAIPAGISRVLVLGNFIGTDVTGTRALPNNLAGVDLSGTENTVGGTTAGARNLISGNGGAGILIASTGASSNLVQGNEIGTDVTGAVALGNAGSGVSVYSANNTIGGPSPAARNLISGNGLDGINLTNAAATGNLVQGNFIGTDVTGASKLGNARFGVVINSVIDSDSPAGSNNTIGGSATGAGNLISGKRQLWRRHQWSRRRCDGQCRPGQLDRN